MAELVRARREPAEARCGFSPGVCGTMAVPTGTARPRAALPFRTGRIDPDGTIRDRHGHRVGRADREQRHHH